MKKYLNLKTSYGVETVAELSLSDFNSIVIDGKLDTALSQFRRELRRLRNEYMSCGMNVYISSRCDKSWDK